MVSIHCNPTVQDTNFPFNLYMDWKKIIISIRESKPATKSSTCNTCHGNYYRNLLCQFPFVSSFSFHWNDLRIKIPMNKRLQCQNLFSSKYHPSRIQVRILVILATYGWRNISFRMIQINCMFNVIISGFNEKLSIKRGF